MKAAVLVFVFFCATYLSIAQQQKAEPLSQLHIGAGWVPVLQFRPVSLDYTMKQMARVTLGVNYLKGYIKGNIQFTQMIPNGNYPGCIMIDNSIAYHYHHRLYKNLTAYVGGQLGLNTIKYAYVNFDATSQSIETETTAGTELGLQQFIFKNVGLTCSYKVMRIYATPRNNLNMLDIGVVYFFKPSIRLKKWLE